MMTIASASLMIPACWTQAGLFRSAASLLHLPCYGLTLGPGDDRREDVILSPGFGRRPGGNHHEIRDLQYSLSLLLPPVEYWHLLPSRFFAILTAGIMAVLLTAHRSKPRRIFAPESLSDADMLICEVRIREASFGCQGGMLSMGILYRDETFKTGIR